MKVEKELKYPIKYAIMPIEEQTGWYPGLNELERVYDVVANIVSKCYVVGERKTYLSDGTFEIQYEVVFMYDKNNASYGRFVPSVPEYNFYFQCTNSIVVEQLFNSFEEALVVANQHNNDILYHEIGCLSFDDDFKDNVEMLKLEHQERLERYKKIEKIIETETADIMVSRISNSLEEIIEKIALNSSDFYTDLANALSVSEREYLTQLIENRSCSNCINGSCGGKDCKQLRMDGVEKLQESSCLNWDNPKLVGKQLILKRFSVYGN